MLSAADAQLAGRDQAIPGLACVLDAEALADGLRARLPGSAIPPIEIPYTRYKQATSCLVGLRLPGAGVAYAKAYRRGDGDKAAKTVLKGGAPGPWGPGCVRLADEVVVSFFPNDRKLAVGRRLADSDQRRSLFRRLLPGRPDAWDGELRPLRYKPERRYVARLDGRDGPVAVLRCYGAADFERAAEGARAFTSDQGLHIAALLGASRRHRVLALEWLDPGPPPESQVGAFAAVGEALARLHAQPVRTLRPLDREEEAALLPPVAEAVAALVPHLAADARSLAERLGSALRGLPRADVPIHGDFSADQVLLGGDRVAIVDYDAATLGDPASDLGLFRASLLLDVLVGALPADDGEHRILGLLDGYGSTASAVARLDLYTAVWLLRLAVEPFRRRLPDWPEHIEATLRCAGQRRP